VSSDQGVSLLRVLLQRQFDAIALGGDLVGVAYVKFDAGQFLDDRCWRRTVSGSNREIQRSLCFGTLQREAVLVRWQWRRGLWRSSREGQISLKNGPDVGIEVVNGRWFRSVEQIPHV
jgi:hypothetical protein